MQRVIGLLVAAMIGASGCGGSAAAVDPDTDEFDVSPSDQAAIDDAASSGDGAEGTYSYDEAGGTLTLTLTASTFECGIETGTLVANVTLTPRKMVWTWPDGDGEVTWIRVDMNGTGIVGIWTTDDPNLYLILSADGTAQVFGDGEACDDDRTRNEENCVQMGLSGATIAMDGDFSDWSDVGRNATLEDESGDHTGSDAGLDLKRLRVEYAMDVVYALTELHAPLSTDPTIEYRITVRGDGGLSLYETVYYDTQTQQFATRGYASEIDAVVGDEGIEWSIDVSAYASGEHPFANIDMVMIDPMDCSGSTCQSVDYMDCAWFPVPQ